MKLDDFITYVSENNDDMPKYKVKKYLEAITEAIVFWVAAGERIQFTNFGTFKPYARNARKVNTQGKCGIIDVPARVDPKFVPSPSFRKVVNDGFEK